MKQESLFPPDALSIFLFHPPTPSHQALPHRRLAFPCSLCPSTLLPWRVLMPAIATGKTT